MKIGTKYEANYPEKCQRAGEVGGERGRGRHGIQIWDAKDIKKIAQQE